MARTKSYPKRNKGKNVPFNWRNPFSGVVTVRSNNPQPRRGNGTYYWPVSGGPSTGLDQRFRVPGPGTLTEVERKKKRKASGGMSSYYVGRFKKRRARKSREDIYMQRGFKNTLEVCGSVTDPDCVYVGHSTTSGHRILTIFLQAALRKLVEKSNGQQIGNMKEPLLGIFTGGATHLRFVLHIKTMTSGAIATVDKVCATTDSIYTLVGDSAVGVAPGWPDLYNYWVNYAMGAGGAVPGGSQMPYKLEMYSGPNSTSYQLLGQLFFPRENINLWVTSNLKIQNRSKSADGDADADDVSRNPIQGKLYQFNSSVPRSVVNNIENIEVIPDATGVITERAADFPAESELTMREPPEFAFFRGLTKKGYVRLQPGSIKRDVLNWKLSMQCHKFFERLDWRPHTALYTTAYQMKAMGKCTLIALEDVINVNVLQNIDVAYEVNRVERCYLTTGKRTAAIGIMANIVQSDDPE